MLTRTALDVYVADHRTHLEREASEHRAARRHDDRPKRTRTHRFAVRLGR